MGFFTVGATMGPSWPSSASVSTTCRLAASRRRLPSQLGKSTVLKIPPK
jgi:hypothetical protein